jgi:hypothetical protein
MSVTNAALRIRIHRLVAKWRPIMGLQSWGLTVRFDEPEHMATCAARPQYEEAVINFNLPRVRAELPNNVAATEELVVHELTHCLIWKSSERAVSWVTRTILRARDEGKRCT